VILGKSLNLREPQLLHLQIEEVGGMVPAFTFGSNGLVS
jgi:hypothetical protein